ncbi:MAG: hypothetical protein K9I74_08060 [Bacteroidales bacterium]|nr:hypothetical protein [Bacteroidales bacterium]
MESPEIIAALIAGFVSILVSILTFLLSKRHFKLKLQSEIDSVKQQQYLPVLTERLKSYPLLWNILIANGFNKIIKEEQLDKQWLNTFWNELLKCNEQIGYLFSQPLYERFHAFMNVLVDFINEDTIDQARIEMVITDFITGKDGFPGLASLIKDDFGSYERLAIQGERDNWF